MGRLNGKVAVILGASSGIGKASAILFAKEGAKLAICARRMDKLEETVRLCREAGAEVLAAQCDVSDTTQMKDFVEKIGKPITELMYCLT